MTHFNGPEYQSIEDHERLSNQIERVKKVMSCGSWRTLGEIEILTGDPQASVSAQLRHLRKKRFGQWVVERRARGNRNDGLFEYRLLPPGSQSEWAILDRKSKLRMALEAVWKHPETPVSVKEQILKIMK